MDPAGARLAKSRYYWPGTENLYFEFLVLLSNLEKIKSLSLSLLESGESFKKFLFLLSNLEK